LHRLRRGRWRNLARIVLSVGQKQWRGLFERLSFKRFAAEAIAEPNRRAIFHQTGANTIEILEKPIVIESHRADDTGMTGKGDDPDPVVSRASMNRRVTSRMAPTRVARSPQPKILGQHRLGNVEHQHDVDPTGLDLGETCAELWTAIAIPKNARPSRRRARKIPARAALVFPSERRALVEEKVSAAAGPLFPRK
jgi:hypothetical protein